MGQGDFCRPISLERVDADVTVRRYVGVINLREKEPSGRRVREVVAEHELDVERTSVVGRPHCASESLPGTWRVTILTAERYDQHRYNTNDQMIKKIHGVTHIRRQRKHEGEGSETCN